MSSAISQEGSSTRSRWGSGARSWLRYQATAAARLPASACSRSSHSGCVNAAQVRVGLFGQGPVVAGVATAYRGGVGPGGQLLGDE